MLSFRLARLWPPVVLAAALFLGTWAMLTVTRDLHTVSVVWPVDAVVAAFLVRWTADANERRLTLALTIPALVAANMLSGSSFVQATGMWCLNASDMAFAAWLVRKVGHPIDSPKAFAAFVAGAVLAAPAVTGLAAGLLFAMTDPSANGIQVGLRWASAAGLGMVIVGALALTVRAPRRDDPPKAWLQFLGGQAIMLAGVSVVLLRPGTPALFMIYPFLVIGALSHRELGGVTAQSKPACPGCFPVPGSYETPSRCPP